MALWCQNCSTPRPIEYLNRKTSRYERVLCAGVGLWTEHANLAQKSHAPAIGAPAADVDAGFAISPGSLGTEIWKEKRRLSSQLGRPKNAIATDCLALISQGKPWKRSPTSTPPPGLTHQTRLPRPPSPSCGFPPPGPARGLIDSLPSLMNIPSGLFIIKQSPDQTVRICILYSTFVSQIS